MLWGSFTGPFQSIAGLYWHAYLTPAPPAPASSSRAILPCTPASASLGLAVAFAVAFCNGPAKKQIIIRKEQNHFFFCFEDTHAITAYHMTICTQVGTDGRTHALITGTSQHLMRHTPPSSLSHLSLTPLLSRALALHLPLPSPPHTHHTCAAAVAPFARPTFSGRLSAGPLPAAASVPAFFLLRPCFSTDFFSPPLPTSPPAAPACHFLSVLI